MTDLPAGQASPSGTTWYDYDKMGRVIMETKQIGGLNYRTGYSYDLNGNLISITYPGTRKITYGYNQANRVTSVTETMNGETKTLASNITYKPFGGMTSLTYGNGLQQSIGYNNRYQITSISTGNIQNLTYSHNANGNITGIADVPNPAKNKSYTYDNLNRLKIATGQWGSLTYNYDSVGNRTYETTDAGNTTYNYAANKLISSSGEKMFSFSYDNSGNTAAENSRQYIYNQNQRLTQVTDTDTGILAEYIYNGNGQRVEKWIPSENKCTIFHYDLNGLLISESTSSGNIKAEYVYLNGQPLAKIEGNDVYYYHNDHLGTPQIMTDSNGSTVWQGEFKPFGEQLSVNGSITNNIGFPGQYYDSETALNYNWFRYYDAKLGRYTSFDPILNPANGPPSNIELFNNASLRDFLFVPANLNPFVYSLNNPIRFIDQYGLDVKDCFRPMHGPAWAIQYHRYLWIDGAGWGLTTADGSAGLTTTAGKLEPDNATSGWGVHCVPIQATDCQKKCLKKEIDKDKANPPNYNLITYNCHHWVNDIFKRCDAKRNVP